jgi:hypothetical protein
MNIINKQIKAYQENFIKHKDSPKGTFQNNVETQYLRFSRLIQYFTSENATIHDVGCGIADMYNFFNNSGINNLHYSGTDIVPEMVAHAKQQYPELIIQERDFFKVEDRYDYVTQSGMFNLPGEVGLEDWKEFCFDMIDKMYEVSKKAMSFNFLTSNGTFRAPELFYMDPVEVFNYCLKKHSRFVFLDNSYPLYEFTVTIIKSEEMALQYPKESFVKYFK